MKIKFTSIVQALPATIPFVGPEALEREMGHAFSARIGANESAFGVSPHAAQAMRDAIERISWYGDPEGFELCAALSRHHQVRMDQICLGAGIDDLLGVLVRVLVEPETPVVTSLGAYPTFNYHVAASGGRLSSVPYRDDHEDLDALLAAACDRQAALVYLSNPDNPMGTWHSASAIKAFADALPQSTMLVLDEAYAEFAPISALMPIDADRPNLVRMRTFSKAHGMAGARIGYAIGHVRTIEAFSKVRNHFGVSRIAQAGALASLGDPDFTARVVDQVAEGRSDIAALARELNFGSVPSATNFVAIDLGGDGQRARRMLLALQEQGIFVRMPGVAPLDRCIRVTVGTRAERALFAGVFRTLTERMRLA